MKVYTEIQGEDGTHIIVYPKTQPGCIIASQVVTELASHDLITWYQAALMIKAHGRLCGLLKEKASA